jgi:hypothetical protein
MKVRVTATSTIQFNAGGLRALADARDAAGARGEHPRAFRLIGR